MSIQTGRRTLYELVAEDKNGQRILLMYCSNRGRRTVLEVARKHAEALVSLTGRDSLDFAARSADGAVMGDWKIRWTGRTQREAVYSKLPWIGDIAARKVA